MRIKRANTVPYFLTSGFPKEIIQHGNPRGKDEMVKGFFQNWKPRLHNKINLQPCYNNKELEAETVLEYRARGCTYGH